MTKNPYIQHKSTTRTSHEVWNEGHAVGKVEGFEDAIKKVLELVDKEYHVVREEDVEALRKQPSQVVE